MIFFILLQLTTFFVHLNGQCAWKDDAFPSVSNGHRVNLNSLTLYTDNTAEGFFDIECDPGFASDPTIGSRITCLETGLWSNPFPQCKSMGSCLIADLFGFVQTADGIQFDPSKSFIYTNDVDGSHALGGSNLTLQCQDGYVNVGGPLTILCTESNTWTPFPQCISSGTTTAAPRQCPVDDQTWIFPNGYLSTTTNLFLYSDNTAEGSGIVSCSIGYQIDSTSQGVFSCNDGSWSPRPICTKTARCSLSTLQDFINDSSLNVGLNIISQQASASPGDNDGILPGSYVLFSCATGYTNQDGNLNVTCRADGSWSSFPTCVAQNPSIRCSWQDGISTFVANGYRSDVSHLQVFTDGFASGYLDVQCDSGYQLDPSIGGRITCLSSGSWSQPLPQCIFMGSCSLIDLNNFIQNANGIQLDPSLNYIYTNGIDNDHALGGSNMTVRCADGYSYIGGELTIVCTSTNTWTPFPQCLLITPATTSLTVASVSQRCSFTPETCTFPHGYLSNTSNLLIYNDNTAEGFVVVSCSIGYVMDSSSQGIFSCNAGLWSLPPTCTATARCSLSDIQNFVGNSSLTVGLSIQSQSLSRPSDESDSLLIGSSITFRCQDGFSNTDGNLNVICNDNGQWTPFPTCNPITTTVSP